MTEKYTAWQVSLIQRDETFIALFVIAAALVAAWALIDALPLDDRGREVVRGAYLAGGLALWVVTLFAPFLGG